MGEEVLVQISDFHFKGFLLGTTARPRCIADRHHGHKLTGGLSEKLQHFILDEEKYAEPDCCKTD